MRQRQLVIVKICRNVNRFLTIPSCIAGVHISRPHFSPRVTLAMADLLSPSTLKEQIAAGEFDGLLTWLREQIHTHGRRFSAAELCVRVTGKPLSHEPMMRHLNGKLREIYRI